MKRRTFFGTIGLFAVSPAIFCTPEKMLHGVWYYHHDEDRKEYCEYIGNHVFKGDEKKKERMEFKGSYIKQGTRGPQHLYIMVDYWDEMVKEGRYIVPVYI